MNNQPTLPGGPLTEPDTTKESVLQPAPSPTILGLVRQKWREYVIEILVIIVGITLSFALNAWKEQQSKKELEQIYLKSLQRDISSDIEALNQVIDETAQVVAKARTLLSYSAKPDAATFNEAIFLADLRDVFERPNFVSNDAAFTDLKSSGNMQILTDFGLKNNLFNYYKHYEAIKAVEEAERDATLFLVAPYMAKHFSFNRETENKATSNQAVLEAIENREYTNSIFVRLDNREELLAEYKDLLVKSRKIQAALQKQID